MREPRVQTGKRTMLYMALSLALTAAASSSATCCQRLAEPGKTMNAVLAESFARLLASLGMPSGDLRLPDARLRRSMLFVAVQTGSSMARVMANMAIDSWLPRRFASCLTG